MLFKIYTCTDTYRLCKDACADFETWIPIKVMAHRDRKGVLKKKPTSAMPGYIFVPKQKAAAFEHWAASTFRRTRALKRPDGTEASTDLNELLRMQAILRQVEAPTPKVTYKVGDKVYIVAGPFANFYGVIANIRQNGMVRMQLGSRFLTISQEFLKVA